MSVTLYFQYLTKCAYANILETEIYLNVILQKYRNPFNYHQDTLYSMSGTRHTVMIISFATTDIKHFCIPLLFSLKIIAFTRHSI